MKKDFAVFFTENNARIIRDIPDEMKSWPNVLINPGLSHVWNVPPHLWKMDSDGQIVAMNEDEKSFRLSHIDENGAHNDTSHVYAPIMPPKQYVAYPILPPIVDLLEVSPSEQRLSWPAYVCGLTTAALIIWALVRMYV